MFAKELKYRIRSLIFIVVSLGVFFMVYSEFLPDDSYFYARPLTFSEYSYVKLKESCYTGKMKIYAAYENIYGAIIPTDGRKVIFPKNLSEDDLSLIEFILHKFNPDYTINEDVSDMQVVLSNEEALELVRNVELGFGASRKLPTYMEACYEKYLLKRQFVDDSLEVDFAEMYEKEQVEFEQYLEEGYTNPYARIFADELGILAGILPVLYVPFLFYPDRKQRVWGFLAISSASSSRIVGKRLLSVQVVFAVLFYLAALVVTGYFAYVSRLFGYHMDGWAFLKYVTIWVMPTLLVTTSMSVCLDIVFRKSMLVCLIQALWFLVSVSRSVGRFAWYETIARFHLLCTREVYEKYQGTILLNRAFMVLLSLFLFFVSVFVYDRQRQGKQLHVSWKGSVFGKILSGNFTLVMVAAYILVISILRCPADVEAMKQFGELYLSPVCIFIFMPFCDLERSHGMYELACAHRKNYVWLYVRRVVFACVLQAVVIAVPVFIFCIRLHEKMGMWYVGLVLSAVFFGILGMLVGELLKNRYLGIVMIAGDYMRYLFMGESLSIWSAFGYTYGQEFTKEFLVFRCAVLMLLLIWIVWFRRFAENRRL